MRLLYVIDSLAPGGAETSLAEMAPHLADMGIDLHVLPLADRMHLANRLAAAGANVHPPAEGRGRIENVRHVMRAIGRFNPSLVHTTLYEADVAGRIAARLKRVPASSSWVNQMYGDSHSREAGALKLRLARGIDTATAQLASHFHAVSNAVAQDVSKCLHISANRIMVIPRGRDPERFPYRPQALREITRRQLDISPTTPVILGVGRQEPQKGFRHLMAALPAISKSHPEAVVLIAGRPGRDTSTLEELAKQAPLDVRFLGGRDDMPALYAASDLLAFPSEREGSPGTLIEAMASGTPIVASDILPCQEVLGGSNPDTALIVPVGNVASLAEAASSVLSTPEAAARRSQMGRERFERHYTIRSVSNRMAQFFMKAANNRSTDASEEAE